VNRRAGRLVSRGRIHRDGVPRLPRRILLRLLHSFPVAVLAGCLLSWALTGVDPVAKLIYAWNLPVGGGPIASRHTGAELMYDGGTVVEVTLAAVVMASEHTEGSISLHNQPGRLPHDELDPLRLCFRSLGSSRCPKGRLEHRYMRKRRETMMVNESGPNAGVEGVAEDVKGRAKEAFGAVTGNESVKKEGEAQQDKAAAQRDVAAKEAEAEKARAEARAAEAEERSHQ
jgi:uncharacterized protein YjbJ (UPF0337 family)